MPDTLPKISIITPSFNQAAYLERTLRSVLDQGYSNLEYIVIDGGSTDGSVDIIRRYADRLAYWVSEPDRGQTDALNKGLRRATGDWIAWQNSDDIYFPGALHDLAKAASRYPKAGLIIGDMMLIDTEDRPIRDIRYVRPSANALIAEGMVLANQASFWRREVQERVGLLNETFHCSFDYEWFLRLTEHTQAIHVNRIWGALRLHGETKTSLLTTRFQEENQRILAGREMPVWKKRVYQLRRIALMMGQGQIGYVLRGLMRQARGQRGALY